MTSQDAIKRYARNQDPGAWLHRCAVNTAINRRESLLRRQSRERRQWSELHVHAAPERPEHEELRAKIDETIAALPEDDRELLIQHYFVGRTQAEPAEDSDVSQPAVSKKLNRIVSDLRARLKQGGVITSVTILAGFLSQSSADAAVPAAFCLSNRLHGNMYHKRMKPWPNRQPHLPWKCKNSNLIPTFPKSSFRQI